jgi:hypothetical protein
LPDPQIIREMRVFDKDHRNVVGPFGYCIYCGSVNPPLSKEHVIPHGLGGSTILLKASCEKCADITKRFEQICLRENFGQFRWYTKMSSRNPKGIPTHMVGLEVTASHSRTKAVPIDEMKPLLILPRFTLPPRLRSGGEGPIPYQLRIFGASKKATHAPEGSVVTIHPFKMDAFYRLLAKIAHGKLVAYFNMDGIEPLLLDLILKGELNGVEYLIGDADVNVFSAPPLADGHVRQMTQPKVGRTASGEYLIAFEIQLFCPFTDVAYSVIAGRSAAPPQDRPDPIKRSQPG